MKPFVLIALAFALSASSVASWQTLCSFESPQQDAETNCTFEINPGESSVEWSVVKASESPGIDLPKVDGRGFANGSYVFANFSRVSQSAEMIDIESSKITSDDDIRAVRFQYYFYGTRLGDLELHSHCGREFQFLWKRGGVSSQAPGWIHQQVPIEDPSSLVGCSLVLSLTFYATARNFHGAVALDGLSTSNQVLDSFEKPQDRFCSFEYPHVTDALWTPVKSPSPTRPGASTVGWSVATVSANFKAVGDHTFKAPGGHVTRMLVQDRSPPGCFSATLQSQFAIESPSQYPKQCLQMSANWLRSAQTKVTADIYVQLVANSTSVETVWTGSLNLLAATDKKQWTTLQALLDLSTYIDRAVDYRLAIEGVICSQEDQTRLTAVALDDIRYSTDCVVNGDDDFEKNNQMRLWLNDIHHDVFVTEYDHNWLRVMANHSFSYLQPHVDHSLLSGQGWLLVSEDVPGARAKLYFDLHNVKTAFCINFWTWTSPNDEAKEMTITRVGAKTDKYTVKLPDGCNGEWIMVTAQFFAESYSVSRVVIEARGGFAVDDITYTVEMCGLRNVIPERPFARSEAKAEQNETNTITCDFDPFCNHWTVALSDEHDHFQVVNASGAYEKFNGPRIDASGMPDGNYALLIARDGTLSKAVISSNATNFTEYGCLRFGYYMYGPSTGEINVHVAKVGQQALQPVWTVAGSQQDEWKSIQINLRNLALDADFVELAIEARRQATSYYHGAIAIDSIQLLDSCFSPTSAEANICQFEGQDSATNCKLDFGDSTAFSIKQVGQLGSSVGLNHDVSLGTELGHVVFASDLVSSNASFSVIQPERASLDFMYQRGSPCVEVSITVADLDNSHIQLQRLVVAASGSDFGQWTRKIVALPIASSIGEPAEEVFHRVRFEAKLNEGCGPSWIAFDDLAFDLLSPPRSLACKFVDNRCSGFVWQNLPTSDYLPWLRKADNGLIRIKGPQVDSAGYSDSKADYALADLMSGRGEDKLPNSTLLVTDWQNVTSDKSPVAISFFYYFSPPGPYEGAGELRAVLETEEDAVPIWSVRQGRNQWQFGRTGLARPTQGRFRFRFEAIRHTELTESTSKKFAAAIDDISVAFGVEATNVPVNANPNHTDYWCSFELSDDVTCNFNWNDLLSDSPEEKKIAWVRVRADEASGSDLPAEDSTGSAKGMYAYLQFNATGTGPSEAVLESIPVRLSDDSNAIQFRYLMFGTKLATLSLFKKCNSTQDLLWRRTDTATMLTPEWQRQQVLLRDVVGCSMVFEASFKHEHHHGVVAIDSIALTSSWEEIDAEVGTSCTFEYPTCSGWWLDKASTGVQWERVMAGSESTSIGSDHSLASPEGYVLRMQAPSSGPGCYSAVIRNSVPLGDLSKKPVQCLELSGRMLTDREENATAQLLVHVVNDGNFENATVWSGSLKVLPALKNRSWVQVRARADLSILAEEIHNTVAYHKANFYFEIEGVVCTDRSVSVLGIAIDDLRVNPLTCRLSGDEDFEALTEALVWKSVPSVEEIGYNWVRVPSNHSLSFLSPPSDHTFVGKIHGGVMVSEDDLSAVSQLSLDLVDVTSKFCLNFWIWTANANISQKHLVIRTEGPEEISEVYEVHFNESYQETWELVTVPLAAASSSVGRIVIEAHGGFAVDDIFYTNYPCSVRNSDFMSTKPVSGVLAKSMSSDFRRDSSSDRCDFESESCPTWKLNSIPGKDTFVVVNASYGFDSMNGPRWDSTFGEDLDVVGSYLLLAPVTGLDPTEMTAFIYSTELSLDSFGCLSFSYYMYGPATGSLKVYVMSAMVEVMPLWIDRGSQQNEWLTVDINLHKLSDTIASNITKNFSLIIEAERFKKFYSGAIAVDDIVLSPTCQNASAGPVGDFQCSFEGNDRPDCVIIDSSPTVRVEQVQQLYGYVGLEKDATYGTLLGHVVIADVKTAPNKFTIQNTEGSGCLLFSYQRGSPCTKIRVLVKGSGSSFEIRNELAIPLGYNDHDWSVFQLDLPQSFTSHLDASGNRDVTFEVLYDEGGGYFGCSADSGFNWAAFDDFKFLANSCKRQISCNFGSYCAHFHLNSLSTSEHMPWLIGNGDAQMSHITGPEVDSNNVGDIRYGLVDLTNQQKDIPDTAIFSTEWLFGHGKPISINFFYYFSPRDDTFAELSVYIKYELGENLLWQFDRGSGTWQFGRAVAIQPLGRYRIAFYGKRLGAVTSHHHLAIDDISIIEGLFGFRVPEPLEHQNTTTAIPATTSAEVTPTEIATTTAEGTTEGFVTSTPVATTTLEGTTESFVISTVVATTTAEGTTEGFVTIPHPSTTSVVNASIEGSSTTSLVTTPTTAGGLSTSAFDSNETSSTQGMVTSTEGVTTIIPEVTTPYLSSSTAVPEETTPSSDSTTASSETTATLESPTFTSTFPTSSTSSAPAHDVNPVVNGEMSASQVIVSEQVVTWFDLTPELEATVIQVMEEQLRAIYSRAGLQYGTLEIIGSLKEVPINSFRMLVKTARRAGSEIGADYSVTMAEVVSSDTDWTEYKANVEARVSSALTAMSNDGSFDAAFGAGQSPSVAVTNVGYTETEQGGQGLDGGQIAGIVIGSVTLFALLCIGAFFGVRYYQGQRSIQQAAPASRSYYDNVEFDNVRPRIEIEMEQSSRKASTATSSSSSSSDDGNYLPSRSPYGGMGSTEVSDYPNRPSRSSYTNDPFYTPVNRYPAKSTFTNQNDYGNSGL